MSLYSGTIVWLIVLVVAAYYILRHVTASSPAEKVAANQRYPPTHSESPY